MSKLTKKEFVESIIDETPEFVFQLKKAVKEIQVKEAKKLKKSQYKMSGNAKTDMTWNPTFLKAAFSGETLGGIIKHEMLHLIIQGHSVEESKKILMEKGMLQGALQ